MNWRKRVLVTNLAVLALVFSASLGALRLASADTDAWGIVLPTNQSGADNHLLGTVAISDSDVWAVGTYYSGFGAYPMIQHWNGSSWSMSTAPSVSGDSELYGVAAVNSSNVWAVGYEDSGTVAGKNAFDSQPTAPAETLIAKYNGSSWSKVSSVPSPGTGFNTLRNVCFNSTTDGWAVGFYYDGETGPYRTLALHWNGTSWTQVTTPNPGTNNYLYDVHCNGTSDVWAVGNKDGTTLVIHYNGTSWSTVTSPNPSGSTLNFLQGVDCLASNDCLAVGSSYASGNYSTLAMHWGGSSWGIETTPNPAGSAVDYLADVQYVSSSWGAWGVGAYDDTPYQTLTLKRTSGGSWSTVSSPNQGSSSNRLSAVTVYSNGICDDIENWAVGWYYNTTSVAYRTLAEQYTMPAPCE